MVKSGCLEGSGPGGSADILDECCQKPGSFHLVRAQFIVLFALYFSTGFLGGLVSGHCCEK